MQATSITKSQSSKHRANRILNLRRLILDGETKFNELLGVTLEEIKKRVY